MRQALRNQALGTANPAFNKGSIASLSSAKHCATRCMRPQLQHNATSPYHQWQPPFGATLPAASDHSLLSGPVDSLHAITNFLLPGLCLYRYYLQTTFCKFNKSPAVSLPSAWRTRIPPHADKAPKTATAVSAARTKLREKKKNQETIRLYTLNCAGFRCLTPAPLLTTQKRTERIVQTVEGKMQL